MVGVGSYNGNTSAAHFPSLQVELRTCLGEALISVDAPQHSIEGPGLKYSHVCDGASAWVSAESDQMVESALILFGVSQAERPAFV
jgi:hypothetical protein